MAFTVKEFRDLVRLLEEHPQWRDELRRLLLTDELLDLPRVVRELAEAQRETERRLASLTERVEDLTRQVQELTARVDALTVQMDDLARHVQELTARVDTLTVRMDDLARQVQSLAGRVEDLTRQVQEMTTGVSTLLGWQRGEAGRREGERYERSIVKRAPMLFSGGVGGPTDDPRVQERLSQWLRGLLEGDRFLPSEEDPTLADLIWWKGDQVVVVEVSVTVDEDDVWRAVRRARTLQSAGVDAVPVVIGDSWDSLETQALAEELGVWWLIHGVPSEAFVAFRRRSPEGTETPVS
ncbi:Chromosome partition protein Smc [bacterium HR11]|nr:Chromosome partition protein Smc [bacterium HR11]